MNDTANHQEGRMRLLFYLPEGEEKGVRLLRQTGRLSLRLDLEVYRDDAELSARLREPSEDTSIVLLYAPSRSLLREMGRIRRMFGNAHLLLVLPGRDAETLAVAYRLRPTFITTVESDMLGLVSAIETILSRPGRAVYSQAESL